MIYPDADPKNADWIKHTNRETIRVKGKLKEGGLELNLVWKAGEVSPESADRLLGLEERLYLKHVSDTVQYSPVGPFYKYPWRDDPDAFLSLIYTLFEFESLEIEVGRDVPITEWPTEDENGNPIIY